MDWLKRNIGTVSLLLFALGAFLTEFSSALPEGVGARTAQVSIIVLGAARALVVGLEVLKRSPEDGE